MASGQSALATQVPGPAQGMFSRFPRCACTAFPGPGSQARESGGFLEEGVKESGGEGEGKEQMKEGRTRLRRGERPSGGRTGQGPAHQAGRSWDRVRLRGSDSAAPASGPVLGPLFSRPPPQLCHLPAGLRLMGCDNPSPQQLSGVTVN